MDMPESPTLFHHDETMPPIEPGTFGFGGGFTRRSLLAAGGALSLAALLAACGGDNKGSSNATTTAASSASSGPATTTAATAPPKSADSSGTTAAARTEAKAETITIAVGSLQEAFVDPHWAVGGGLFPLMWAVADFLYGQDQEGKFVPRLATGYDLSADGLTWTFKLRSGVKNHDGSAFTANDVKTAVDRITVGPQASQFTHLANFKSFVTGATVVDPQTVQIITNKPFATCVVDMPAPIATDYYNQVGDAKFKTNPVATGPWKFTSQELNANVKYDRHDDFWDASRKPNWKKLVYAIVPDESSRVAGVKTGTIDVAYGLGVSSAEGLKGQSGVTVNEIKSTGLAYCMMVDNVFPDAPSPLKDANVRKALLMAIDRDAIGKSLYKGYAVTPGSQWPLITPGFNPDTKPVPYDPDGAKKLLSDAGQTSLKFTLNTYASTTVVADIQKLAEAIIAYWSQVGVKADLNVVDPSTYTTQWRNKQLHGAGMIAGPTAYYVEPTRVTATSFFGSMAPYSTIVGDAKLDGLIAQANNELDATKRTAIGRQIADYLDSQLWGLPIITTSSLVVTGPNVATFGYIKAMPYAGPTTWIIAK